MNDLTTLANLLIAAQRDTSLVVPASEFSQLSLGEAEELQDLVKRGLGRRVPAAKIGLNDQAGAVAAPIYDTVYKASGEPLILPKRGAVGIEVEVAVMLNRDLTFELAQADDAELLAAVDAFVLVIEPLATRYDDRTAAGPWGPLADNLVTGGLVHASDTPLPREHKVDGLALSVTVDGEVVYSQSARHPFGDVLTPLRAYAGVTRAGAFSIKAGTLVTTGSLCRNIVPVKSTGRVEARLGKDHSVTVEFI
ncbi:fumarylacetoacetate hydrolase family protein [Devosia sp. 2618]|uniref:fumarylacetoacetate hydrolase family protein n=1 Tax=Devosia sp. 2618 TaxID=3156454 RepID=UPI00339A6628